MYVGWGTGMGEKRVVCGYHGNAQSLSYNYMGKNGSRTFTPRYTPPLLSPDSVFSPLPPCRRSSGGSSASSSSLLLLLLRLPPRLLLRTPSRFSCTISTSCSSVLVLVFLFHLLRLLLLRLLLLIRLHLAVSSHRGTYFARLGNIMLAPYRGDCVTILNSL